MPSHLYLHEHKEFEDLIRITASEHKINELSLVEKDYWIMQVLHGLKRQGFEFELKGGTSLSKGFGIIDRFSEDIDIRIEPPAGQDVKTRKNQDKKAHVESRRRFYDWLTTEISIPGVVKVERDHEFDNKDFWSGGIRLRYESHFEDVAGLKPGILLEVGFDKTTPNSNRDISSWAYERAVGAVSGILDNRALQIRCYDPQYTFVEKLQTVAAKYKRFEEKGDLSRNFLRHYYDIFKLIVRPEIQAFIGTEEYLAHKNDRFKSLEKNLMKTNAFLLEPQALFKRFEEEYSKTTTLYYRHCPTFAEIVAGIKPHLNRL